MLRQLLNVCLIVTLLLQGVTQATVDVQNQVGEHCANHESDRDCSCCDAEPTTMASGCAVLCSVIAGMPRSSFALPAVVPGTIASLTVCWRAGPAYAPLIPPPIS